MILELQTRATSELGEGATPLDYAETWVASGKTILALAKSVGEAIGETVLREQLTRYLHEAPEAGERLSRARATGAHGLVEEAIDLVDGPLETREEIQQAKLRADVRQWTAAAWNRAEYGQDKGVNVAISFNASHLDVLRARATMVAPEAQQLGSGEEVYSSVDVVEG